MEFSIFTIFWRIFFDENPIKTDEISTYLWIFFPLFCKRFAVLWFHLFLLPFAFRLVSNQGLSVLIWLEFFHTFLQKPTLSLKNHHSQKWTQNWRESKKTTKNGNFWSLFCFYRRKLRANFVYKKKTHTLNKQTNYKSTIIFSLYRTMLSDGCLRTERTEYTPPWKWFLPSVLRILRMYTYTHSRAHTQTMKLSLRHKYLRETDKSERKHGWCKYARAFSHCVRCSCSSVLACLGKASPIIWMDVR